MHMIALKFYSCTYLQCAVSALVGTTTQLFMILRLGVHAESFVTLGSRVPEADSFILIPLLQAE